MQCGIQLGAQSDKVMHALSTPPGEEKRYRNLDYKPL